MSMAMVDGANNTYLRVSHRPDGGDWSAPYEPLATRTTIAPGGGLAADAAGTITLAIGQGPGTQRASVHQLAAGNTVWTRAQTLSDPALSTNATRVGVAAGPAGSTMVIWQQSVAGFSRILTSRVTSTVTPTPQPTPTPTASPTVTPPAPAVVPTSPTAFVKVTSPSVSGKARVGRTLKAHAGTWQPTPATVTYQWRVGTKSIKRATKPELKLTEALRGKRISVRITVSAPGLSRVTLTVRVKGRVR